MYHDDDTLKTLYFVQHRNRFTGETHTFSHERRTWRDTDGSAVQTAEQHAHSSRTLNAVRFALTTILPLHEANLEYASPGDEVTWFVLSPLAEQRVPVFTCLGDEGRHEPWTSPSHRDRDCWCRDSTSTATTISGKRNSSNLFPLPAQDLCSLSLGGSLDYYVLNELTCAHTQHETAGAAVVISCGVRYNYQDANKTGEETPCSFSYEAWITTAAE